MSKHGNKFYKVLAIYNRLMHNLFSVVFKKEKSRIYSGTSNI